jgi:hypothetical protein
MNDLADDFDPRSERTAIRGETVARSVRCRWLALPALMAALCAPALLLPTGSAKAQEIEVSGPLAGAPAVIGLRAYRDLRFQIQAHTTMTLEDEFSRSLLVGGQLMFHVTDWLGIGAWGGFAIANIDTSLTDEVAVKGQTNQVNVLSLPNPEKFPDQIGHINWIAAPQLAFIPLRGKLGIFEKLFVDADFYVHGGIAFVGLEERAAVDVDQFNACKAEGGGALARQIGCFERTLGDKDSRTALAPTFGAGLSLYLADFVAMTIEWRALPFAWNTSGTDESGDSRGDFPDDEIDEDDQLSHFNHMMTLGFAFYFPTKPSLSYVDEDEGSSSSASASVSAKSK